ncbi:MAG: sodium-translocating pyrophosphatase [Euryarchaeota archaeon]|nr:sodium-translocating pyrophosphatase [Euryarchaeota archaeon]
MFLDGASDFEKYGLWVTFVVALAGLAYAWYLRSFVLKQDEGTDKMKQIAAAIQKGAEAYLRRQLRTVIWIIAILALVLFATAYMGKPVGWETQQSFISGYAINGNLVPLDETLISQNITAAYGAGTQHWMSSANHTLYINYTTATGINRLTIIPTFDTAKADTEWIYVSFGRMVAFLMGAGFSATVGYFGMKMAVRANVRVAQASRKSLNEAVTIGYRTGAIVGMLTDGLGLLGGVLIFMVYDVSAPEVLLGFGFGGTLLALFMRVGGGIYTKAADVGADLVGKVEKNIPEDDPRNAAVIADNVGDNVGDCAGMAADIFESYEVTMVSAMILGLAAFEGNRAFQYIAVVYPLLIRAIGVVSSIVGTYIVRTRGEGEDVMKAIHRGYYISAIISIVGFWALAGAWVLPAMSGSDIEWLGLKFACATMAGIVMAIIINNLTDYFTSTHQKPVKEIVESTNTGSATTILQGLSAGMESSVWSLFVIVGAIIASAIIFPISEPFLVAYGVALCGIGMLTLTGNTISMDTFGPIADNANGIGEMAGLEPDARQRMADMDAVGNTTKAITKGIAIGSAVVAATCLFMDFVVRAGQAGSTILGAGVDPLTGMLSHGISISSPILFAALLIGGAIPFLFSAMCIRAVGRAAQLIVVEVRRQFREIKGLWEGTAQPDYEKPVDICTRAAQKELVGLGLLAVLSPVIVGLIFNEVALGAFLGGAILSAQLMAVFMANAGGAWDNAKKSVEDEPRDPERNKGKGSERHKASVVGDTVGDPLKDTAGPALNPMVKVINLIAVLIVPVVVGYNLSTGTKLSWTSDGMLPIAAVIGGVAAMVGLLTYAIWVSKKK